MLYLKIKLNDNTPLETVERWSTGILQEIAREHGRIRACKDTVQALRQRMDWSGSGEKR